MSQIKGRADGLYQQLVIEQFFTMKTKRLASDTVAVVVVALDNKINCYRGQRLIIRNDTSTVGFGTIGSTVKIQVQVHVHVQTKCQIARDCV